MSKGTVRISTTKNRTRSMGGVSVSNLTYSGQQYLPPYYPNSGTIQVNAFNGNMKIIHDVSTPGFRQLLRNGARINNPLLISVAEYQPYLAASYRHTCPIGYEDINGPTVAFICGRLENNVPSSGLAESNLLQLASTKAWAGVEPAKSQSLVTVLEAHKSWKTISDRARKLAKIVEAVRRKDLRALRSLMPGNVRRPVPSKMVLWDDDGLPALTKRGKPRRYSKAPRVVTTPGNLDATAKLWLEYRYGWCPLVYDMIDQLKAIYAADLRSELLPRDILTSRGKVEAKNTVTTTATRVAGTLTYYTSSRFEFEWVSRTYIHYRWKAPDGMVRRLNDFGLFDVPRALWEITPFSFIADWFVPIGDWLGALTPKIGVEYIDRGHTIRRKVVGKQEITGVPAINPPGAPVNGRWTPACPIGSADLISVETVERFTHLNLPYYPPIDVKLNVKRMADVAALFKSIR